MAANPRPQGPRVPGRLLTRLGTAWQSSAVSFPPSFLLKSSDNLHNTLPLFQSYTTLLTLSFLIKQHTHSFNIVNSSNNPAPTLLVIHHLYHIFIDQSTKPLLTTNMRYSIAFAAMAAVATAQSSAYVSFAQTSIPQLPCTSPKLRDHSARRDASQRDILTTGRQLLRCKDIG